MLTGRQLDAEEALSLRLVSEIMPQADLASRAVELAQRPPGAPRDVLVRNKSKFLARADIAS
ncbi:MAG TPA: hypothetical protein VGI66_19590, partial [Streptosporangiaceae bacterium]